MGTEETGFEPEETGSTPGGVTRWKPRAAVEAWQLTEGNAVAVVDWIRASGTRCDQFLSPAQIVIRQAGKPDAKADVDDWIVRGWQGAFWVVLDGDFEETYEPAGIPSAAEAALSVAKAALHRLSLIDEMAGMGQRDDDPELIARCRHAAGALATIDRLFAEAAAPAALVMPPDEFALTRQLWDDLRTVLAESEGWIGGKDNEAFARLAAVAGVQ